MGQHPVFREAGQGLDRQPRPRPPRRRARTRRARADPSRRFAACGREADVERWESDSDSDASADEAEADETAGTLSDAQLLRLMA